MGGIPARYLAARGIKIKHFLIRKMSSFNPKLLQASFNSQTPQTGFIKEWTLMLHGTADPPYTELSVLDPHSKLAIVKKAHEGRAVV